MSKRQGPRAARPVRVSLEACEPCQRTYEPRVGGGSCEACGRTLVRALVVLPPGGSPVEQLARAARVLLDCLTAMRELARTS